MSTGERETTETAVSTTEQLQRALDVLDGADQSELEAELVRRLADRARELAVPADPPLHVAELENRRGRDAEEKLDPEIELEAARFWFEGDVEFEHSVESENGRSSLTVELPAGIERAEPPSMTTTHLDPEEIRDRDLDVEVHSRGEIKAHLALSSQPEFVEFPDRELQPDEDQPTNVFPPDSRYVFRDTSFPWSTAGRVETAESTCTGTMVGEDLLLTASYCIDWQEDGTGWLKFTPAY